MMRPFTLICMVSAFGAGLYLYQSKHQAQMLDREIGRTIKLTESTRERTGMLRAEWALLNEPDRLAELAKAHTSLQTLKPTQFVGLNDLAARLPAPVANNRERLPVETEPEDAPAVPVAQAAPPVVAPTVAATVTPAAPAKVVVAAEPKPKQEAKTEAKPVAVAEAKPVVRHVEKPAVIATVTQAEPAPVRARAPQPPAVIASNEAATAPGTVGAAVMRAMRAQNAASTNAAPAYVQPAYSPPAYAPPAYVQPSYARPAYAAPASSVLGGSVLPPPVPFAAR
jgi:hypothetical protein